MGGNRTRPAFDPTEVLVRYRPGPVDAARSHRLDFPHCCLSTLQLSIFIVLPQALRAVTPALVGQTIAIFKDTSLVAIVGLFDFLFIAD